ncbi:MAG: division/cell wall cluster transcriptional repressor MraZ [Planctomycetia bacterium]|nr:division/cell wall cluster transcriptional repressor MraZ [Planctomycetia bacterium]
MSDLLTGGEPKDCVLAKERPGCLSLWSGDAWEKKLEDGVNVIKEKIRAGLMDGRIGQVQMFGRLLSTRNTTVQLAGRGRLLIPDRFRPFLGVEPGHEVIVVGASVCIELWNPTQWYAYLNEQIPAFRQLFDTLAQ